MTDPSGGEAVLELAGVTKRFGDRLANDNVDLSLGRGEIHALLGENGAGKTTLMNVLFGLVQPDAGRVLISGRPTVIDSPATAIRLGLGMVHQHFMLSPTMTVTENIILGSEPRRWGLFLDRRVAERRIAELSEELGLAVDPRAPVGALSVGARQRVEILKTMYRSARVIILDEPTATLTPEESRRLFETLAHLVGRGRSVIFITHKLSEVMQAADQITVLRAGRVAARLAPRETTEAELAALMVGHAVTPVRRQEQRAGGPVLEADGLYTSGDRGGVALADVSLTVRAGEIYGLAGIQGNGQSELVDVVTGLAAPERGRLRIAGRSMIGAGPGVVAAMGVAHVPEDRQRRGLVLSYPITDNRILNQYRSRPFSRWGVMLPRAVREAARRLLREFSVQAPGIRTPAASLSGGNQQKVVMGRELSRPIRLLVAAQPTRGLDVGSAEFIRERILEKRSDGCAVLLVSADLDEIFALADRIGVMVGGRLVAEAPITEVDRATVGLWMAGGRAHAEARAA